MIVYKFRVHEDSSVDESWEELSCFGKVLFSSDDIIWAEFPDGFSVESLKTVVNGQQAVLDTIDWEDQWKSHGKDFKDGYVTFEINDHPIKLIPGAGFGDLSHPTTRLMVDHMQPYVKNRNVFDVGCGSGVLSLAACAFGAKKVYALDIDPLAVDHTRQNSEINQMDIEIVNSFPEVENPVGLMNMIWSEQKLAYIEDVGEWLTSGVLKEESDRYLKWWSGRGYSLTDTFSEDKWCCFYIKKGA